VDSSVGTRSRELYEYWFELIARLMGTRLTELPYAVLADALNQTFDAVGTADHRRGPTGAIQELHRPGGPAPGDEVLNDYALERAPREHPLLRFYLAIGDFPVVQVEDVPDRFADRVLKDAWFDLAADLGHGHQVALCVPTVADGFRALVVGRSEPYSPEEMLFAARLRTLLVGLAHHVAADGAWLPTSAPVEAALSARESVVLAGLARGLTADAVGRELTISPRTVHKHLERAYAKLGVRDRVSAVLRARALGVL
jgi:DNA-binding CsgD family transcriptional regulator